MKILVVDDEVLIARAITKVLEKSGYEVFSANSGHEAINLLQKTNTDLAIIDFLMPEISGRVLAEWIKNNQPGCAVHMMTAYSDEQVIEELKKAGVKSVISKPFENIMDFVQLAAETAKKN